MAKKIYEYKHPDYREKIHNWKKYRLTYTGGKGFVNEYLTKFSKRETVLDFNDRKRISYCPAHAKAAIIDIKNAIYQRMRDIVRIGGSESYQKAVDGRVKGVDLKGNTMDGFIGRFVLPELLSMEKVGVFIDRKMIDRSSSVKDLKRTPPYLYIYKAEDIFSWTYNEENELITLLLRDYISILDPKTGLETKTEQRYRLLRKTDDGIVVTFYNKDGFTVVETHTLNLKKIPFVLFEISDSLLIDVADYQIALLNLASSDLNYALKSNFPFYIEQYDPKTAFVNISQPGPATSDTDPTVPAGTEVEATQNKKNAIEVGVSQGRQHPIGTDAPSFIHPSSEPLEASMKKQEKLQTEIRQLVNLAVTNVQPQHKASAESKQEDEKSLEAGLSYIGMELEYGEESIAAIWHDYENSDKETQIRYPDNYSLRDDEDRREEVKELQAIQKESASLTLQKEIGKQIAITLVGSKVSHDQLEKIKKEIDESDIIVIDPETIRSDLEAGLVGVEYASELRGYPKGQVERAKKDHAERAARILLAQTSAAADARGVPDVGNDPNGGKKEKEGSQDPTTDPIPNRKTRGDAK